MTCILRTRAMRPRAIRPKCSRWAWPAENHCLTVAAPPPNGSTRDRAPFFAAIASRWTFHPFPWAAAKETGNSGLLCHRRKWHSVPSWVSHWVMSGRTMLPNDSTICIWRPSETAHLRHGPRAESLERLSIRSSALSCEQARRDALR